MFGRMSSVLVFWLAALGERTAPALADTVDDEKDNGVSPGFSWCAAV